MNTKITLDEWLQHTVLTTNTKPENAFTVNDVLKKTTLNRKTLISRLDALIQQRQLKKGECIIDGRKQNYYIPIELNAIHNNQNERPQNESKRTNGRAASKVHSRVGKQVKSSTGGIKKTK